MIYRPGTPETGTSHTLEGIQRVFMLRQPLSGPLRVFRACAWLIDVKANTRASSAVLIGFIVYSPYLMDIK